MLLMGQSHLARTGLHSELAPRVYVVLFFGVDDHGLWPEGLRSSLLRSHGGVHACGRVSSGCADGRAAAAKTEPETPPGAPRPGASHAPNRADLASPSIGPATAPARISCCSCSFWPHISPQKKMEKLNFSAVFTSFPQAEVPEVHKRRSRGGFSKKKVRIRPVGGGARLVFGGGRRVHGGLRGLKRTLQTPAPCYAAHPPLGIAHRTSTTLHETDGCCFFFG